MVNKRLRQGDTRAINPLPAPVALAGRVRRSPNVIAAAPSQQCLQCAPKSVRRNASERLTAESPLPRWKATPGVSRSASFPTISMDLNDDRDADGQATHRNPPHATSISRELSSRRAPVSDAALARVLRTCGWCAVGISSPRALGKYRRSSTTRFTSTQDTGSRALWSRTHRLMMTRSPW